MPLLVVQIPPRPRAAARHADAVPAAAAAVEYDHVLSTDGQSASAFGRAVPALLPKAERVVAVLADADVAWHRITLPKAPAAKLRGALTGVLEEALLDDDEALHLALAPGATAGSPAWVAAIHKPWLAAHVAALEAAGLVLERVVPAAAPGDAAGHFWFESTDDEVPTLALVHADGAATLRLQGSLARALLPAEGTPVRWTATPAAAAAAERWLGAPVSVLTEPERLLQAARTLWNLRQFDLAPRHRGLQKARDVWRQLMTPAWRPVRLAALALAAVQLVGLNVAAFRAQRAIDGKRAELSAVLQRAHPGVKTVYDAAAQMERETALLRAAAGRPGDTDLEMLLGAAAAAWPDGQGPVQTLRFEAGRLTLAAAGWGEPQLVQFRDRLRPSGYAAELAEGRVTVSRARRAA